MKSPPIARATASLAERTQARSRAKLARQLDSGQSRNHFDLVYPFSLSRLDERRTTSMTTALGDLGLDALCVVHPGDLRCEIGDRMIAAPTAERFRPGRLP